MTRSSTLLALAASACALAACGGSGGNEPVALPFTRIEAFWPTLDLKQTYAIRDDNEWRTTWAVHLPTVIPEDPRPQIDFTQRMVLGITQGWGPSGCHGLVIERVVEDDLAIRVEYRQTSAAPPDVLCTMALVPLTDFVVVKRSDKPVSFLRLAA